MRKLFAITMLAVYLFNLSGYNFLFGYYINKSDERISKQADALQYSDTNLKEIKIKLNLPYLTDWSAYERYDGKMEIEGVQYNYIKRKISQDTLYLLCLPNEIKTQLFKTKEDYAARANDLPSEKQGKFPSSKKSSLPDGGGKVQLIQFNFSVFNMKINKEKIFSHSHITDAYIPFAGQPPEANS